MQYHVQIAVGNGKHPWRNVSVAPTYCTLKEAIARITSTGHAASWVRVIDTYGHVVVSFKDGVMATHMETGA